MGAVQIVCTTIAGLITLVAVALAVRAVTRMLGVDPARPARPGRGSTDKGARTKTMLTRDARPHPDAEVDRGRRRALVRDGRASSCCRSLVLEAYFEVVDPSGDLPLVGGWAVFGLVTEIIGVLGIVGILVLIGSACATGRRRASGRSRFTGSTMWQALLRRVRSSSAVLVCGFLIRGLQGRRRPPRRTRPGPRRSRHGARRGAAGLARRRRHRSSPLVKIVISMAWLIVISLNLTMGVAWHRFPAFLNIFFKRTGQPAGPALGALQPMMSDGKPLDFEEADPEKDLFGVAQVEHFTWKGLLDFSTCTECGRCQSQCPAWNTGKPLSPKLLILSPARPRVRQGAVPAGRRRQGPDRRGEGHARSSSRSVDVLALAEADRPLIGDAEDGGVIDPDVLWSCTTCGACVEQCPVDIEHVDHIVDMRRYQVLIESSFPSEAGVMLRNLENKGNPWGAPPNTREDWTKGLDFEVPRVGDGDDFEYLFWVGCAGAFEDRAKKTTRAVATLLHEAGVELRDPRRGRDLHRRPGPPDRQRVRLPDARPAERRDAQRGGRQEDRRDLPALLQHPRATSTRSSAASTRSCTTPSCWPTWSRPAS